MEPIGEASASILSPSDISFDKTEEDLDMSYLRSGRKWKRGSSMGQPSAPDDDDTDTKTAGKCSRRNVSIFSGLFLLWAVYRESVYLVWQPEAGLIQ